MSIDPKTEGEMYLTVSKENFITFEDTVYVSNDASLEEDVTQSSPSFRIKRTFSKEKVLFELYLPA